MRPLMSGWGRMHWASCLPLYALAFGASLLVAITYTWASRADGPSAVILWIGLAIFLLWAATTKLAEHAFRKAQASAPASGMAYDWAFDESGVGFTGPLTSSRYRWEAIKAVKDETDRIVILISPVNNPVLPKRQLTDQQLSAIRALINEATASGRLGAGVD